MAGEEFQQGALVIGGDVGRLAAHGLPPQPLRELRILISRESTDAWYSSVRSSSRLPNMSDIRSRRFEGRCLDLVIPPFGG